MSRIAIFETDSLTQELYKTALKGYSLEFNPISCIIIYDLVILEPYCLQSNSFYIPEVFLLHPNLLVITTFELPNNYKSIKGRYQRKPVHIKTLQQTIKKLLYENN